MMAWHDDPNHPFAGIAEKLARSNESIRQLDSEIRTFFKTSRYPVIPNFESKEWQIAIDYHRGLSIPKRFSVLSGEIIHHLRSCLDHIAWHFSSLEYRIDAENAIEFPIFREKPASKSEISRFERKINGISNPKVRDLLHNMQPYQQEEKAENDPLCIVHDMDRFDKHRELTIVTSCANVTVPMSIGVTAARALYKFSQGQALNDDEKATARRLLKEQAEAVSPQVAFAKFGSRKITPVIPALSELQKAIVDRVHLFAGEV